MRTYDIVIATCWLLFFVVWAGLAMVRGGGRRLRPLRHRLYKQRSKMLVPFVF